ncbi:MAG TPA: 50S ribosomal protein L23 [Cyclobacteriaceae bacterium]|jgi:large subunit ribosomal protein L23
MSVLIKPLVTEKMSALNEKGQYGFVVNKKANKIQIRQEIEKTYGVKVQSVRTMRYGGKEKSRYTKATVIVGKTPSIKKAIVQVADGEVIDFYGGI